MTVADLARRAVIAADWMLCRLYGAASKVGDREFFDNTDFPWIGGIEADWRKVRRELDALLPHTQALPTFQEISDTLAGSLTQDDGWRTFWLYAFGTPAEANCRRCPETAALLQRIPGMQTAFFSILAPGKQIPPHRGIYKGVLRLHLPLLIPDGKCGIRVGTQVRHWAEGEAMVFDDVHPHEAWNLTPKPRVVLFVDIVRPLRFPVNLLNKAILRLIAATPMVRGAVGNHELWEKRFEELLNESSTR